MKSISEKLKSTFNNKWMRMGAIGMCVVMGLGGISMVNAMADNGSGVSGDYTVLQKTDLTDSISVKGIVESQTSRKVYSALSYNVETIYVEVGDYVTEGLVLAQLDTEDLELKLSQKKEDLTTAERNNLNQLQNSQRLLGEASSNLNNGTNSQIVNAQSGLKTAEVNLENAKKAYDDAVNDANRGINSKVASAQSSLETAKMDLDKKETDYNNNKSLYEAGALTQDALDLSEKDLNNSRIQYNDALLNLENAKTSDTRTVEQAEEALKTAQTAYDNAVKSVSAAQTSAKQEISNYQNSVQSAQIAVDSNSNVLAVEEMEKQLKDSAITAPIDGTVTAVYAKEGVSGQGLLFVIEDTSNLKIKTYIKEYDIADVTEGMEVIIKSDATGDAEYKGAVDKIEPAAVKTAAGETASSSDVEFGTEIAVVSEETDLRIGMNTRMNIIIDSKESIYRVPFDAVKTTDGSSSVFLLNSQGRIEEIPVTTGLETDFYIEIEGDGLYDGAKIMNNAAGLEDGMKI